MGPALREQGKKRTTGIEKHLNPPEKLPPVVDVRGSLQSRVRKNAGLKFTIIRSGELSEPTYQK
jgi:hypothetical protein